MRQAGIGVDIQGFEIISRKRYLVGKCVKNGHYSSGTGRAVTRLCHREWDTIPSQIYLPEGT